MRSFRVIVILGAALCLGAQGQNAPAPASERKGLPPRAAPTDYEAHATAGNVTIGAEFLGHSIPRAEGEPLITDDYVVIETGLYGPPGTHTNITVDNFKLRINEKKKPPIDSAPYGMIFSSLKEPEWQAEQDLEAKKAKDDMAGVNKNPGATPAPKRMPLELQRAIQDEVRKAALPEGDRPLPEAGLIFFRHGGKVENIHSMELIYTGPTGTATLPLQ